MTTSDLVFVIMIIVFIPIFIICCIKDARENEKEAQEYLDAILKKYENEKKQEESN